MHKLKGPIRLVSLTDSTIEHGLSSAEAKELLDIELFSLIVYMHIRGC